MPDGQKAVGGNRVLIMDMRVGFERMYGFERAYGPGTVEWSNDSSGLVRRSRD